MPHPLRSRDDLLAQSATYGALTRFHISRMTSNTTAATANSGGISAHRFPETFVAPSAFGVGLDYAVMTNFRVQNMTASVTIMAAIEFELGSLNVNTNAFADGVSMPSRPSWGVTDIASAQLPSLIPMLYVSATLTATTPVITTTYANQAGTGSRTCTMTLPTNPVTNSAYMMGPHLQSTDMGVTDVSNMSKSAGTAGTLKCVGLLPVGIQVTSGTGSAGSMHAMQASPYPAYPIAESDVISFWKIGSNTATYLASMFSLNVVSA